MVPHTLPISTQWPKVISDLNHRYFCDHDYFQCIGHLTNKEDNKHPDFNELLLNSNFQSSIWLLKFFFSLFSGSQWG